MPELIFIFIVAIIIMGPKDMQKAGKTIGKWLRNLVTSDGWKIFQQTSRELRNMPTRLMREANEDLNKIGKDINDPLNNLMKQYPSPERSLSVPPVTPLVKTPEPAVETKENKDESDLKKDA
ncbi:MAG: twin-arginine translocase TatA/TatE family subunit [Anaerolineales bacterium]|nr:twin-arginine translocase TatA/TatE family subunit [Anaerolineales bacterium]